MSDIFVPDCIVALFVSKIFNQNSQNVLLNVIFDCFEEFRRESEAIDEDSFLKSLFCGFSDLFADFGIDSPGVNFTFLELAFIAMFF